MLMHNLLDTSNLRDNIRKQSRRNYLVVKNYARSRRLRERCVTERARLTIRCTCQNIFT